MRHLQSWSWKIINNIDHFDKLLSDLDDENAHEGSIALPGRKDTKSRYSKGTQVEKILIHHSIFKVEDAKHSRILDSEDISSKYQGWTAEGIARYNELYTEVKKNRETLEGKAADERVWKQYMRLCNLDGDSQGDNTGADELVADDSQEIEYENGYDDFAMIMVWLQLHSVN